MKIVLQRVAASTVFVEGKEVSRIGKGLMILLGVEKGDEKEAVDYLVEKVLNLRIFADENGKMNLSCLDIQGKVLVVSQFTLAGDCSKGRRPGFDNAAPPDLALDLYKYFLEQVSRSGLDVQEGKFGANMQVEIQNDGPVTFLLER